MIAVPTVNSGDRNRE